MTNPDSVINEEAETKAIEKWLRMVDKPLATKEEDRKGMNLTENLEPIYRRRTNFV